ncbi:G2/mitotic-specific cyclin-B3-like [Colossoma macropomum]|uniref:G2/mitotic-specific cyclin-B3-like n=1 Tax=Colossoma macropomum TaxID=42526 RepID=UPI0018642E00|nr:G2/mitotic-specific cyclin-B3-like [Colossoma macropomum]
MPFQRSNKHSSLSKRQGKVSGLGNQEEVFHVKRTPSSPQGGPKKRSAFVDLTNTNKVQNGPSVKSGKPAKKALTSKAVKTRSKCPSSEEQPKKAEGQVEGSLSEDSSASRPKEQSAVQQALESAVQEQKIPEAFDIDKEQAGDCLMSPEYAKDIFDYLKNREEKFVLTDYMHNQPDLNGEMRGILVDWMVEVQENFELNHETLYLAVKLTDHYLAVTVVMKESLQLIGSTAMLIAAKFEERCPPCVDDFLYICDDAYKRQEFIVMERNILQGLNFDINIPVPYRFLRRYAKVAHASMETLTLARYVCELSLLELELVPERASHLASACLLLALITKGLEGWTAALQYHTGYVLSDLSPLVRRLYAMLASPSDEKLKAVENKYSHKVFFEVAKIPLVHIKTLEDALTEQDISQ